MFGLATTIVVISGIRTDLRTDGVPVVLADPGEMEREFAVMVASAAVPERFSDEFVSHALATGVDWRTKGAVTAAKDQGAHGYCGTFGRTCAFEGQYAMHAGRLRRGTPVILPLQFSFAWRIPIE